MSVLAATRFQVGHPSHWMVLAIGLTFLSLLIFLLRRHPDTRLARVLLGVLIAGNLLAAFSTAITHFFSETKDLDHLLPLHLCDIAAWLAALALITRKPLFCTLTYFLGLGGTLQGLITPNVHFDFPHPIFFSFFQLHLSVVIAALVLPLGLGWRPPRPLWRTGLLTLLFIDVYLLIVFFINSLLGTNYAFLMRKPENPSLLDHLGPHPWYHLSVQGLIIFALFLLSLPFVQWRRKPLDKAS